MRMYVDSWIDVPLVGPMISHLPVMEPKVLLPFSTKIPSPTLAALYVTATDL